MSDAVGGPDTARGDGRDGLVHREAPLAARVGVLGGLYLVQGIVWGFGGLLLLPRLAAAGVPLEQQTGIFALAGLPWVFKLGWGPVLDGATARRLGAGRVAALATAVVAAALLAMALLTPAADHVAGLAVAWLALNAALSLQDVSTDALAFDLVPAEARGRATAVMLAGHHVGAEALAGAWVGGIVAARGLPSGLIVLAGVALVVAVIVGATTRGPHAVREASLVDAARRIVRSRRGWQMLVFATLVFAADVLTSAVSGQWFVELGWSPEDAVARVVGILLVGNLVGYASAIAIVDRIGHGRVVQVASASLGVVWLVFAATRGWWAEVAYVQAFIVVQSCVTAWLYVATHAVLMDATVPEVRATQFAIFTACLNLPRVWVPAVGAWAVGGLGFVGTFAACGAWQVGIGLLAWALGIAARPVR